MRGRLREESGIALVMSIMLMGFAILIGLAVMSRTDGQTRESANERVRESSFDLAEAAMNAQTLQLSRSWPSSSRTTYTCNPTATDTACPDSGALLGGYSSKDYAASCATAQTAPPIWDTEVRDNNTAEQYWQPTVMNNASWDANADGLLWVRSTAYVQCKQVSIVSLASRSVVPMDFPQGVITANRFSTNNQGRKVIVDTLGTYSKPPRPASQPAPINVRCGGGLTQAQCLNYQSSKGQVSPPAVRIDSSGNSSALSLTQLQMLEQQAAAAGTYFNGTCPTSASQLASVNSAPVVIKGPCTLSFTGNTIINSSTTPGVLVLENGTLTLGGTLQYYGLIYAVDKQGCPSGPLNCDIVTITGNAQVIGAITVDGLGGVMAGSSKTNVIYDSRVFSLVRGSSGAALAKNTFRVLPPSTP